MKFKRPARSVRALVVVELTPLIDVVFLLLIFFMVSTTFVRETALGVELPPADGDGVSRQPGDIEVRVDVAGHYAVNGEALDRVESTTLVDALNRASAGYDPAQARVVLAADAGARHDAVVHVLDAARQVGLTDVSILTDSDRLREREVVDGR